MTRCTLTACRSVLAALFVATGALAYDQPAVNLGFTSFLDGIPPAGPGWYAAQYVQFYTADKLPDLPFPGDPELEAWISLTQVIYQHPKPVLGSAQAGLNLMLPVVAFDLEADGTPLTARDGLGDLLVGPYLQWAPIMGDRGPVFVHRVEFQVVLPTGEYDETRSINPGSHVVSLNPYYAATWFLTPKWTLSGRFHYLWNDRNTKPNHPDPAVRNTQAGQALHANFASEYEVLEKRLRIGINGYAFTQIEDSRTNGNRNEAPREQVFAIGPGALWSLNQDNHLFVNVYLELDSQSRPEGERFNVRYVHHF